MLRQSLPYPVIPKQIIRTNDSPTKRNNSPVQTARKSSRLKQIRSRNVNCFAERLIPLRKSYQDMTESFQIFTKECNINSTNSELMTQLKSFNSEYEIFCSQANIILSSILPSTSLDSTLATSTTIHQAEILLREWSELINRFNSVTENGLMPHFLFISKEFTSLKNNVKQIVLFFSDSSKTPAVNLNLVKRIYERIDQNKKYYYNLYRQVEFRKPFEYDADEVLNMFKKLIRQIGSIFNFTLPNLTMSTGEIMQKKIQVTYQCENICSLIYGTGQFTHLGNLCIDAIQNFNNELKSLLTFFQIPFNLELKFHEEEEEEPEEEAPKSQAAQEIINNGQKAVDSMRKRIADLERLLIAAHNKRQNLTD